MFAMMDNAKVELENDNLLIAAYDINLLHNLPEAIHSSWDEEHFFSIELSS